jgi:hypothetical protein
MRSNRLFRAMPVQRYPAAPAAGAPFAGIHVCLAGFQRRRRDGPDQP